MGTDDSRAPEAGVLLEAYRRLYDRYGPQHWWPADTALEVILGAILTQAVAWTGVERALANLKNAGLMSVPALQACPESHLATLLRPSGYFNAKARKVKAFIDHLWEGYEGDLKAFLSRDTGALREELLSIHGIGQETADDILLYAAARPSFVIDTYTRRIMKRMGLAPERDHYEDYQQLFHDALAPEAPLFNEYHALLDRHAKEACTKVPRCDGCCLLDLCPTGLATVDTAEARNL